jgi:hypothetical protein
MSASVTFISRERSRATWAFGAVDLTYRDTVHEDGRVEYVVEGWSEGERVYQTGEREVDPSLLVDGKVDLEKVTAARLASGWSIW